MYGFIAGHAPGGDFATFVDGHNEIAICDAMLQELARAALGRRGVLTPLGTAFNGRRRSTKSQMSH